MSGRPDDRYEVRARISPPASRGPKMLALGLAAILVGWAGLTLADRLGVRPAASAVAEGSELAGHSPAPTAAPTLAPGSTYPPVFQAFAADRLPDYIPILRDGLVWLDPADDLIDKDLGPVPQAWPFVLSDGTAVCVCIATNKGGPQAIEVIDFDPYGGELSDRTVAIDATGGPQPMDAVIAPDGRSVLVAAAAGNATGGGAAANGTITLWRIPVGESGKVLRESIGGIDLARVGDLANAQLRLAITPNGSTLRVALDELSDDLSLVAGAELAWLLPIGGGGLGSSLPDPRIATAPGGPCPLQAWATNDDFVQICRSGDEVRLFIESTKRPSSEDDIGLASSADDVGWLVDGTAGVVYGWSATSHRLYRLDLVSLSSFERLLAGPLDPAERPAETSAPVARPGLARWQPLRPAWDTTQSPVVGSPDGSILYGIGLEPSSDGATAGPSPTGVWAFDAATMAIVGHWAPLATYASLAETADGRFLIAIGTALPDEAARFGSQGAELAYLRRSDGRPVELVRRVDTSLQAQPGLLPITPLAASGG